MMQKQPFRPGLAPIMFDADRGAVGQAEAGDVDRTAQGVLAEAAAAVDRAAGKATEMIDADNPPTRSV